MTAPPQDHPVSHYLAVIAGGGLGAAARYGLSGWIHRSVGGMFPFGTLAVNVIGSLLIGLIMSLSVRIVGFTPGMRLFLVTGILGGFTTYSAFSYETLVLMQGGKVLEGGAYILTTVVVCLVGVWAGYALGRAI